MVKFNREMRANDIEAVADDIGLKTIHHFDVPESMATKFGGELYQFNLQRGGTVEETIKRLSGRPGVAYAEPNYEIHLNDPRPTSDPTALNARVAAQRGTGEVIPNDMDGRLWGIRNTGQDGGTPGVDVAATHAWATTTGKPNGQGPLICIIDTGVDYTHPDLAANVWTNPKEVPNNGIDDDGNGIIDDIHGANLITKTGDPMDDNDHATHCAGTIAAVGNNAKGIVGVNWNATLAAAKFLDAQGSGSSADAVDAILYSAKIGARLNSCSWGGPAYSQALYDAFKASPALHVCAAGNDGVNADQSPSYPAAFDLDNVVSVAAIDRNGHLAKFSNYGSKSVDLAAPGVNIYSTQPGNRYRLMSGTSMAAPHVTGVAGLVLSQYPDVSNEQLKARLVDTAAPEDELVGKCVSGGRANAANALENDTTPPDTPSDLSAETAGASCFTLKFTATGDDGMLGRASVYQLRYSGQPITDKVSWDKAIEVRGLPAPSAPGTPEHLSVPISPDDQPKQYYFALRVADKLGNVSGTATTSGMSVAAAVAFKDDFETDSGYWTTNGSWALVDSSGHGKVYTDSPKGSYPGNSDTWIASKPISLAMLSNPRLLFSEKHDTEAHYDFARVEVSADGGKQWDELARYDGYANWTDHNLDLKGYEGKTIQLRFRMTSDGSIDKDGVYIDNVKIAGDPKG